MTRRAFLVIAVIGILAVPLKNARSEERAKKRIAVLQIGARDDLASTGRIIRSTLEYRLFQTGFYDVLERDQVDLILKEKKQKETSCTDRECAAEIGSLISADYVIIGSLNRSKEYDISIKVVNVNRNTIVVNLVRSRGSLEKIKSFSEELAEEVHGKLLDLDRGIKIPHTGSIIFSADFSYLAPRGSFGEILETGYGAGLTGGLKNTPVEKLFLGLSFNALSFKGKSGITHHALLLPVFLEAAYEFDLKPVSLFLFASGGAGYNSNSYYRYTSGTDYYTLSSWQLMTRLGAGISLTLRRYLTLSIKSALWQIYEESSTSSFVSTSAGIGLKF